jgi:ribonuclease BN (tRNA processing enzyme)
MRITLLGTGTPMLELKRQASALLIETGDVKLLFDAGRGVTTQLVRAGIYPQQVDCIFVTHHHHDHIGNLGELLLSAWHNGRARTLNLYGPPGIAEIVAALFDQVYARDIDFELFIEQGRVDIRELVQVNQVSPGLVYAGDKLTVRAEYVDHGNSLGLSRERWPCLGYRAEAEGKVIAISGDAMACDDLDSLARGADVLIQCCYLAEDEINNPEFEPLARYVIASSRQAGQIAARNQVKKLVLTHIRPKSEAMLRSMMQDVRREYDGKVYLGQDLMTIDV